MKSNLGQVLNELIPEIVKLISERQNPNINMGDILLNISAELACRALIGSTIDSKDWNAREEIILKLNGQIREATKAYYKKLKKME